MTCRRPYIGLADKRSYHPDSSPNGARFAVITTLLEIEDRILPCPRNASRAENAQVCELSRNSPAIDVSGKSQRDTDKAASAMKTRNDAVSDLYLVADL